MSMPVIECTNIDKCSAASAILQSIALEETAISHILNAEGEKIQKVLSKPGYEQKEILEVNKSVQDTIDKITCLENILKEKLELTLKLLKDCDQKLCEPHLE
ncbi:MAG: hypothetical protein IJZ44_09065 [Lachnospiraceae bacterium]|nr:hypothetical protein [Lachnospiraceae bacterium]